MDNNVYTDIHVFAYHPCYIISISTADLTPKFSESNYIYYLQVVGIIYVAIVVTVWLF